MSEVIPVIGDIVVYRTTQEEQNQQDKTNYCNSSVELPAIVVAVWGTDCVNLKVMQDGALNDLWVTSSMEGDDEGQWQFKSTSIEAELIEMEAQEINITLDAKELISKIGDLVDILSNTVK